MQRGSVQLLLIIILIILASAGGFIYLSSRKTQSNLLPVPKISKQESLPVYSNYNLEFSLNYLKGQVIKEDSEEEFNKRGNGDYRKNFKGYVGYEPPEVLGAVAILDETVSYGTNPFSVWVFNNISNLTMEQWFDKYWYYPFVWGVFDYTSKGHIALDQEATISGSIAKSKIVSYQPGQPKFVYVAKNNKMYLFRIIDDATHTGDQILSSFKFLIEERFCGGIGANLPENQCPEGYTCKLDGSYPDAGGKCIKKQ